MRPRFLKLNVRRPTGCIVKNTKGLKIDVILTIFWISRRNLVNTSNWVLFTNFVSKILRKIHSKKCKRPAVKGWRICYPRTSKCKKLHQLSASIWTPFIGSNAVLRPDARSKGCLEALDHPVSSPPTFWRHWRPRSRPTPTNRCPRPLSGQVAAASEAEGGHFEKH